MAVTPVLDQHYAIFSTLGERSLQVRSYRPDSYEAGEWAIRQQGQEALIREQLSEAVNRLFQDVPVEVVIGSEQVLRLATCAEVVVICRTHVYRDGYGNREIEHISEPEANTRIAKGLAGISKGVAALNRRSEVSEEDLQDAMRVAFDSIPDIRRRILAALFLDQDLELVRAPRTTRTRAFEDLVLLQVLNACSRAKSEESDEAEAPPFELEDEIHALMLVANLDRDYLSRCVR